MVLVLTALALADTPASCSTSIPVAAWVGRLADAEAAFAARDEARFDEALVQAGEGLTCLGGVVEPTQAARYHRLVGLRMFVRGDVDGARLAFAAARAADPFGALPSDLLPPGHEARDLSATASTPGATASVPGVRGGALYFDGGEGLKRPTDRPTLLQVDVGGAVQSSRYLAPGDPMPDYPARAAHPVAHGVIAALAGALAVAGGVCYGVAYDAAATIDGPLPAETTRGDVLALQQRANGLTIAAGVAGGLAIGGVGVALVRW